MTWLAYDAPGRTPLDRVLGLRPELHRGLLAFYALFWERRLVDPVLLELCRLLAAGLLGCTSEQRIRYRPAVDAGLSELAAASVATWRTAGCFDARERACLLFAEKFVLDPHTIDDADVAAVRDAIGTEATVALTEALALFDGFMRFRRMLGADDPAEPDGVVIVPGPSLAAESLP